MEKERRWQICGNNLKGGRKREIYLVIPRRNFGYFPAVWLISRLAVHFPTGFWLIPPPPPLVDFLPHFVVDDTPRG